MPIQQVCPERSQKHQTSRKQCRPTLSTAFTSNPQDRTRYFTMDNWPHWAEWCKAVSPTSPESKRWPPIFGARYSATARWPPIAHKSKALRPPYVEEWEKFTTDHHLCTHVQVHQTGWRTNYVGIIETCVQSDMWCNIVTLSLVSQKLVHTSLRDLQCLHQHIMSQGTTCCTTRQTIPCTLH